MENSGEEDEVLLGMRYNESTPNLFKNILSYEERKWLLSFLVRHCLCAVVRPMEGEDDAYEIIIDENDTGDTRLSFFDPTHR